MSSAATQLRRAIETFRREQVSDALRWLAGEPSERAAARAYLASEGVIEQLESAVSTGELGGAEHAAVLAHVARARLEHAYAPARRAAARLPALQVRLAGESASVTSLAQQWVSTRVAARRENIAQALSYELSRVVTTSIRARAEAGASVGRLLARVQAPRHADAGPEGGNAAFAERFLAASEDLAREVFALVRRHEAAEGRAGLDLLWALTGPSFTGLFAREGRARRVAADWQPLGLRRLLSSRARVAREHPGPSLAPLVLTMSVPGDVRVAPSSIEAGLASELAMADAVGRAVGLVHASPVLPIALRHATVASVARSLGTLGMLRFAEPTFLRRVRSLSAREAGDVARASAAYALFEVRLSAAALLAHGFRGADAEAQADALAGRAVTAALPPGLGAYMVTRLSPGGALRAKAHAFGLAWSMRERFDEDWFCNPRAAEPLRGAMARAGEFSVEALAEELGATPERGLQKLSELF